MLSVNWYLAFDENCRRNSKPLVYVLLAIRERVLFSRAV